MSVAASMINSAFYSFIDNCLRGGRLRIAAVFKRWHLPVLSKPAFGNKYRHFIVALCLLLIAGFAAMPAMAAPDLLAGTASGEPGQSVQIPVVIDTDGSVAALQLDLSFDSSLLSVTGIVAGGALSDHVFNWQEVVPGNVRLVFTTASASALQDGELATLTLLIDEEAEPGTIPLVLGSIIQSDARALLVQSTGQTNGSVVVLRDGPAADPVNVPLLGKLGIIPLVILLILAVWVIHQRGLAGISFSVMLGVVLFSSTIARAAIPPGDANNDGQVNAADIPVIVEQILENSTAPGDPDCNADSLVDVRDTICAARSADNLAPDLIPPGNRLIQAGKLFETPLFATDPNVGDVLTFGLDTAPAGMNIDPVSGMLSWTPTGADLGNNAVTATVQDILGLTDSETFDVEVVQPVVLAAANNPPQLTVPDDQALVYDNLLSVVASATDSDGDTPAFALVNAPSGMTINPVSGAINWTPTLAQIGSHDVAVKASDPFGGVDFGSFVVKVMNVNEAPVALDDLYDAKIGETLEVIAPGVMTNDSDPNGDSLSAELLTQPENGTLVFSPDGSFDYTPSAPGTNNFLQSADLTRYASIGIEASESFSSSYLPVRAGDQNLATSWFTKNNPIIPPWIQVAFDNPGVLVREVRIFGNREFASGNDFFRGYVSLLDTGGTELWNSGEFDLPAPTRDYTVTVAPPIAGVYAARFTGVDWDGAPTNDPGLSELAVIGDAEITGLAPTLEWSWTETLVEPDFVNINAAITVCDLEGDGPAEIIVPTYNSSETTAILRAFRGDTGAEVFSYTDIRVQAPSQAACGDIDGDGRPEIIAMVPGGTLLALEHDGTFKWQSADYGTMHSDSPSPALADLDGDGTPEIVVGESTGITVFNADGTILWAANGGFANVRGGVPTVADLDLDGSPEVIGGNTAYRADGTVWWENGSVPDGGNAIGNFDEDPFPEIVVVNNGVYLLEHDGTLKWGPVAIPEGGYGGAPTVADFDGDGEPEIGVAGKSRYVVYNADGSVLWAVEIDDSSSNSTGSTVFDFENDGAAEVVYRDEGFLWIFSGTDGTELFKERMASGTWAEYPVVADVDNDGKAEIVVGANDNGSGFNLPDKGLYVYGASNWVRARPIWNQYSYHVTNVLPDGTIPTAEQLNWLTPGLNNFRENDFLPDEMERADSFTYRVNDGTLDSAPAEVYLDIHQPNSAPEIVSTPRKNATVGFEYLHAVSAIDVDDDPLTFYVTGPAGMTIDPVTGLIRWTPGATGIFGVSVRVEDDNGAASLQAFTITAVNPVRVPDVDGLDQTDTEAALTGAGLLISRIVEMFHPVVPAGQVIRLEPPQGTIVEPGTMVTIYMSLGPAPEDIDDDSDGFTENQGDCDDGNLDIYPGATDTPGDGIDQNCDGADAELPIDSIVIMPPASDILTNQLVTHTAYAIFDNGTSQNQTGIVTWSNGPSFASATAGVFNVTATKGPIVGNATVTVHNRIPGDDIPPAAAITAPANNTTVTEPVDIVGTASDTNFFKYELAYAVAGSNNFTIFASSTSPVTAGVLGEFDPTLLINDLYTIRLTVFDLGGNIVYSEITVQVDENFKVGNFTLSFIDLSIPMAGIPITVSRGYDSREKRSGDFGFGWFLGVNTLRLTTNRVLGTGWQVLKSGLSWGMVPTDAHTVSLTFPDGRVEQFDMVVSPTSSAIVPFPPFANSAKFVPKAGALGTLRSLENNNLSVLGAQPGVILLVDDISILDYNPQRFRYTDVDGTQIDIHKIDGIERIVDPNGNTLTFGPGGITHSAGKSVVFARDAQGRITNITDPNGNVRHYSYDGNGDLRSDTDWEGNTSRYTYDLNHHMLDMVTPDGTRLVRNEYDSDGRLISTTDANGNTIQVAHDIGAQQEIVTDRLGYVTVSSYDERGNILVSTNALGKTSTYTYDANNNTTSETDPLGNTRSYTYDAKNNLLTTTDPLGNTTTNTFDPTGSMPLTTTDPLGNTTTFAYDTRSNLIQETDPLGNFNRYAYDGAGNRVSSEDALGNISSHSYDTSGNLISGTDPTGNTSTFTYDANGNPLTQSRTRTTTSGPEMLTTTSVYDGRSLLIETTDPLGNQTFEEYNVNGKNTAQIDKNGNRTNHEYDPLGQLVGIVYPDSTGSKFTYSANGNRISTTDRDGRTTTWTYDALNREIATNYPDGSTKTTTYDDAGRVTSTTDALGSTTSFGYDTAGRRTTITDGLGNITSYGYDANGKQVAVTDANGHTSDFEYDANGNMVKIDFADATSVSVLYDALGQKVASTDQAGVTTNFTYDAFGKLTAVTDALGQVTSYIYDEVGNRLSQTDTNGNTTFMAYDGQGRLTKLTRPLGMVETYSYDSNGNRVAMTDYNGDMTLFVYDVNNRIVNKTLPDASVVSFTYTLSGLRSGVTDHRGLTSYSYDSRDRLLQQLEPDGSVLAYTYDANGNQTSVTVPSGTTTYTYDALNRLDTVNDPDAGVTTYAYDDVGNNENITYPNGVIASYTYDDVNRLLLLENSKSDTTLISSFAYTLDPTGRRLQVVDNSGRTVDYSYDLLYRLEQEDILDTVLGNELISYTYDPVGNRLSKSDSSGATVYSYDTNDRLLDDGTDSYYYDSNGNTLARTNVLGSTVIAYDPENRLINILKPGGSTVQYDYDADGKRVQSVVDGIETNYLVDRNRPYAQVLEERDDLGALLVRYEYGDDLVSQKRSGTRRFYLYDGHGSTRQLVDSSESVTDTYEYDAFGVALNTTGSTKNNYLYTGEQYDPDAGMYYLRARYHDQNRGQFLTTDPYVGDVNIPMSLHRYLYTYSDPVNNIDPSGKFGLSEISIYGAITITLAGLGTMILNSAANNQTSQLSLVVTINLVQLYATKLGANINQGGYPSFIPSEDRNPNFRAYHSEIWFKIAASANNETIKKKPGIQKFSGSDVLTMKRTKEHLYSMDSGNNFNRVSVITLDNSGTQLRANQAALVTTALSTAIGWPKEFPGSISDSAQPMAIGSEFTLKALPHVDSDLNEFGIQMRNYLGWVIK